MTELPQTQRPNQDDDTPAPGVAVDHVRYHVRKILRDTVDSAGADIRSDLQLAAGVEHLTGLLSGSIPITPPAPEAEPEKTQGTEDADTTKTEPTTRDAESDGEEDRASEAYAEPE